MNTACYWMRIMDEVFYFVSVNPDKSDVRIIHKGDYITLPLSHSKSLIVTLHPTNINIIQEIKVNMFLIQRITKHWYSLRAGNQKFDVVSSIQGKGPGIILELEK